MARRWILPTAAILLGLGPLASGQDAQTQPSVQEQLQQLKKIVTQQQEQIRQLQAKTSDQAFQKMRQEDMAKILAKVNADADKRMAALTGWMDNLKFSGDLRLRYQYNHSSDKRTNYSQGRYRLRFGFTKTFPDQDMRLGFRLASGSSSDPTSTNQSFTDHFSEKPLWIDQAWAAWEPRQVKGLLLIAGKMANPFNTTNMLFDSDINPEGVFGRYEYDKLAGGKIVPFVKTGWFVVQEEMSGDSAMLAAYQAGARVKFNSDVQWTSALAYYQYDNVAGESWFASHPRGNTLLGSQLSAGQFHLFDVLNDVRWKLFNLPMGAYVDYVHNCGNRVASDNSDGLAIAYQVGSHKKKGDWELAYKWAYIEPNAVVGAFADSDFGYANRKGSQWSAGYMLTDNLQTALNFFYTRPVKGPNAGVKNLTLQADLIWKF